MSHLLSLKHLRRAQSISRAYASWSVRICEVGWFAIVRCPSYCWMTVFSQLRLKTILVLKREQVEMPSQSTVATRFGDALPRVSEQSVGSFWHAKNPGSGPLWNRYRGA